MLLRWLLLVLGAVAACSSDAFVENMYVIDKNMNPCEDFYTYACESQYINPDGTVSSFKSLVAEAQDNVIAKLKEILEGDEFQNVPPLKLARTFYNSCTDTVLDPIELDKCRIKLNKKHVVEKIDAQGIKPIYAVLKELKGWPITRKYSELETLANWQDLHAFYSKIHVFPLYEVAVNNDALRRTHTVLLRQPKMIVREPLLYKARTFYKYVEYIKTIALLIANLSDSRVSEHEVRSGARQIATFEAEISKILEVNDRQDLYRPIQIKKFQNVTDKLATSDNYTLNWIKIINNMYLPSTKLVTLEDIADISNLSYFPKLLQLLQKTPLRTVVNFIHWKFVHQFLQYTSKDLRNLYFSMRTFMEDPAKNLPRWRFCAFEPVFDHAIAHAFAKKYLTATEKSVHHILSDIKHVMLATIENSTLLNEREIKVASNKISTMTFVMGILDPMKNVSTLNHHYKKLSISKNYFNNVLTIKKFYTMKEFEVITWGDFKSYENDHLMRITTVSSIGSAYDFFENRVLIKAENLVAPLFDPDYPEYKKYGILGFIIAYEIMHAFNDADSLGHSQPRRHLYSEETKLKYWNKMECIINQFDNYYIPDPYDSGKHVYVDGDRSAMENIADTVALRVAFQAYHERLKKEQSQSFEDDEEFFISFASLLCRPELEEFYLSRFNLALRTLPRFRVIGSLSNSNEFAKTFSCPSGAQMNPETKCNFWN